MRREGGEVMIRESWGKNRGKREAGGGGEREAEEGRSKGGGGEGGA